MSDRIQAAINAVQDIVAGVSGIVTAPHYLPDAINEFPAAVCWHARSTWSLVAGTPQVLFTLILEVHVARQDLSYSVAAAMPYGCSVPQALLANHSLSGTVDHCGPIRTTFGSMQWAGTSTVGWRFELDIKVFNAS
jgi:hypothetical protein